MPDIENCSDASRAKSTSAPVRQHALQTGVSARALPPAQRSTDADADPGRGPPAQVQRGALGMPRAPAECHDRRGFRELSGVHVAEPAEKRALVPRRSRLVLVDVVEK